MKIILLIILYLAVSTMDYSDQTLPVDYTDSGVGCVSDCLDPASAPVDTEVARLDSNFTLTIGE